MVNPVPAGVEADLLGYFNSICAVPGSIKSRDDDVAPATAWRGQSGPINGLTHIKKNNLFVAPTDLDGCKTIADIEGKLHKLPPHYCSGIGGAPCVAFCMFLRCY